MYEKTHLGELAHWDVDVTDSKKVTSNMGDTCIRQKIIAIEESIKLALAPNVEFLCDVVL